MTPEEKATALAAFRAELMLSVEMRQWCLDRAVQIAVTRNESAESAAKNAEKFLAWLAT